MGLGSMRMPTGTKRTSPSRLGAIPDYVGKSFKCALIVAT
jgi:hypothetical protein